MDFTTRRAASTCLSVSLALAVHALLFANANRTVEATDAEKKRKQKKEERVENTRVRKNCIKVD